MLYALSPTKLLVLSHKEHVDEPLRAKARRPRTHARIFDKALISWLQVRNDRELAGEAVDQVNYVIKSRARKFVASANVEMLFPERRQKIWRWPEIDSIFQSDYKMYLTDIESTLRYTNDDVEHFDAYGRRDLVPGWFVRSQAKKRIVPVLK